MANKRLERAAKLIAQLHRLSQNNPRSWRRADSIGRDIKLTPAQLQQALNDATHAGLILRRDDDPGLIILTEVGRHIASRH